MNRRHFIVSASVGIAGLTLGRLARAQTPVQPPPPSVTKFEELRRGVGTFIGSGGTIGYLVNADGALAVASQFMNSAEICIAGLKTRAPKGVEMLINTHHHADHTSGNKAFRPLVKRIICQENCLVWHKKVAKEAKNVAGRRLPTRRSAAAGRAYSATRRCGRTISAAGIRAATR